jgi:hypothetical protein
MRKNERNGPGIVTRAEGASSGIGGFTVETSAALVAEGVSAEGAFEEGDALGAEDVPEEAALEGGAPGVAEAGVPVAEAPGVEEAGACAVGSWAAEAGFKATPAKLNVFDREAAASKTRSGRGGFMGKSPSSNPTDSRQRYMMSGPNKRLFWP